MLKKIYLIVALVGVALIGMSYPIISRADTNAITYETTWRRSIIIDVLPGEEKPVIQYTGSGELIRAEFINEGPNSDLMALYVFADGSLIDDMEPRQLYQVYGTGFSRFLLLVKYDLITNRFVAIMDMPVHCQNEMNFAIMNNDTVLHTAVVHLWVNPF